MKIYINKSVWISQERLKLHLQLVYFQTIVVFAAGIEKVSEICE